MGLRLRRLTGLVAASSVTMASLAMSVAPVKAAPLQEKADAPRQNVQQQDEALKAKVQQLVLQLDSAKREQREAAQKELEKLGVQALPLLPEPDERQSVELRRRVLAVRRALEQLKAEQVGKETRVTIQGKQLSLEEVLEQIAKQTGNKVVDYRDQFGQEVGELKLDLDLQDVPFWKAMDAILSQASLGLYLDTEGGEMGLVQGGANRESPFTRDFGPVRFTPKELVLRQQLGGPEMASCKLTVDVMWEQRLRPLYLKHSIAEVRAFDETGAPLEISDEEAEYEMTPPGRRAGSELTIALKPPPRGAKKIGKLQGKLVLAAPAEMETFRFENPSRVQGKELRRGGANVTLRGFRKDDFRWHAQFLLSYDEGAAGAFESYRAGAWLMQNELFLEDKDGQRIRFDDYNGGINFGGVDERTFDITYIFVDVPGEIADYTLFYRLPGTILELPIEYEFADLPLP